MDLFETLPGVEKVVPILQPFKLTSQEFKKEPTVVAVGDNLIGGGNFQIIAGPCAWKAEKNSLK
jgi:3-deoxy-7-phosphoheptulonate synthase